MANDCGAKAVVSEQLRDKVEEFISIKPSSVDVVTVKTSEPVGDASAVLSGTSSVQGIEPLVPRPVVENLWVDPRSLETSGGQGAVGGVPSSSSPSSGILRGSDSTLGDEAYSDATTKSAEDNRKDDEGARIQRRAKVSFSRWSSSSQSVLASLMTVHQGGLTRDSDAGRSPSTTEETAALAAAFSDTTYKQQHTVI